MFSAYRTREEEEHELQQLRRQNLPAQLAQQQRVPVHSRSDSQESRSEGSSHETPGSREISSSPFPIQGNSFVQRSIQFCMAPLLSHD